MNTIVLRVRIGEDGMPFFAEAPYFLWGEVNYESEGNCRRPTNRSLWWASHQHTAAKPSMSLPPPAYRDWFSPGASLCGRA